MIATVVVVPIVLAVLFVVAGQRRSRQRGTELSLRRAVLVALVAGVAGALVATLAVLTLNALAPV